MTVLEILLYGTIQSVSLLLIAFGFSLVYGISRLPNFAHGALSVFTGYVAWVLLNRLYRPGGRPRPPLAPTLLLSPLLLCSAEQ